MMATLILLILGAMKPPMYLAPMMRAGVLAPVLAKALAAVSPAPTPPRALRNLRLEFVSSVIMYVAEIAL